MYFKFQLTGVRLDENEVSQMMGDGWSVFVTPEELKSAFFKDPGNDFFVILEKWPWKCDTTEVKEEYLKKIQEAAKKLGFKTSRPPLQGW